MVTYKRLDKFEDSILLPLQTGYQSDERFRVSKLETENRIEIILELTRQDTLYVKQWECTDEDLAMYDRVIAKGHSFAVYDGSTIIGVALAEAREWNRTFWIWEFHVRKEYQRQGIGKKLMNLMADEARGIHMRTMLVETQNTNLAAIRFYRAVGFSLEGVDLSYYTNHDLENGEVAIFMKRNIE